MYFKPIMIFLVAPFLYSSAVFVIQVGHIYSSVCDLLCLHNWGNNRKGEQLGYYRVLNVVALETMKPDNPWLRVAVISPFTGIYQHGHHDVESTKDYGIPEDIDSGKRWFFMQSDLACNLKPLPQDSRFRHISFNYCG